MTDDATTTVEDTEELTVEQEPVECELCTSTDHETDDCEATFCDKCGHEDDDLTSVDGGDEHWCASCVSQYAYKCQDCDEVSTDYTNSANDGDSQVCDSCLDSYYWCVDCNSYYDESHNHSGCDCEVPSGLNFRVRNGEVFLKQDEAFRAELPSGTISEQGMMMIQQTINREASRVVVDESRGLDRYTDAWYAARETHQREIVRWYEVSGTLDEIGAEWMGQRGNFTKRLGRHAHVKSQLRLSPELLAQIGNIAREQSTGATLERVEFSRDLNLPAGEWYHEDSCWWGSYSESRCALKSNGGIGMRTYSGSGRISGRAWAMPLRDHDGELRPTFDTETPDAWMIFNGYGDLEGYTGARIMAQMQGMTFVKQPGFEGSPMYVNSGGYLVASQDICDRYKEASLSLDLDEHSRLWNREENARLAAAPAA